jgi:hypothetical protein
MENHVKGFGQFINESNSELDLVFGEPSLGIAVWQISDGPRYGAVGRVSFGGRAIDIEEDSADYTEDGEFIGMYKVFESAEMLGADPTMVYSMEDDRLIYRDKVQSNGTYRW